MAGGRRITPKAQMADVLEEATPAPESIFPEARADWDAAAADLVGRRLLTASVLPVLETYINSVALARKAAIEIEERGLLVVSPTGVLKANPATAVLNRSNDTVARLGVQLGLTPMSKSRTGMTPDDDASPFD